MSTDFTLQGMKRLDMTDVFVVCSGEGWRHSLPPCSKEMMAHLERNEKLVSSQKFENVKITNNR